MTTGGHFKPGVNYHVKEDGKAQNKQLSIWHFQIDDEQHYTARGAT